MPIDPVKIPQNVYIEDRIVGPLTLRQTLIIAAGGGFSYALFAVFSRAYGGLGIVGTVIAWIPCAVCVLFALVRINDMSLMRICLLFLEHLQKPSVRTWAPRRGISITIHTASAPAAQVRETQEKERRAATQTQEKIEELSAAVDRTFNGESTEEERTSVPSVSSVPSAPPSPPRLPVDRSRIRVDQHESTSASPLSDLSIFRDIFSHP